MMSYLVESLILSNEVLTHYYHSFLRLSIFFCKAVMAEILLNLRPIGLKLHNLPYLVNTTEKHLNYTNHQLSKHNNRS